MPVRAMSGRGGMEGLPKGECVADIGVPAAPPCPPAPSNFDKIACCEYVKNPNYDNCIECCVSGIFSGSVGNTTNTNPAIASQTCLLECGEISMKIVNKGVLFAFFATLCAVTATYFYSYTMAASLSPEGDYVLVDISCGRFRVELGAIHQKGKVGAFSINISSISSG